MKKVVNHALVAKKKIFVLMALVCAMTMNANVDIVPIEIGEPVTAYDTVVIAEDTLLYPQHPQPIHLDLHTPRKAMLAASCPVDSIVGLDANDKYVSKREYQYDETGRCIDSCSYNWDATGVKTGKRVWYKFTGSIATTTVNMTWDNQNNKWRNADSTQYLYYPSGKMMSNAKYVWENEAWRYSSLVEYEYDAQGHQTLVKSSSWNSEQNALVYSNKFEYQYENGKQVLYAYWTYKNGAWEGGTKNVTEYNGNNKISEASYSGWENGDWKGTTKKTYTYNASNQVLEQITYKWSLGWKEYQKTVKAYEGSNVTDNATYTWKNEAWVSSSRTSTTYEGGQKKEEIKWKPNGGATWVENTKVIYAYSGSTQTMQEPLKWNGTKWIGNGTKWEKTISGGKVTVYVEYAWGTDDWVNSTKEETTYVGSNIGVKTKSKWVIDRWVGVSKTESQFESSRLTAYLIYAWADTDWRDSARTTYTYDAKGDTLLKVQAEWKEDNWLSIDSVTHEVTYTTIGSKEVMLSDIKMKWDVKNGWVGISKTECKYDVAGNQIQYDTYTFYDGAWTNNEHREKAYKDNKSNLVILEIQMSYNPLTGLWSGRKKEESNFDDSNRQILSAIYQWDKSLNDGKGGWTGLTKSETVYNGNIQSASFQYTWDSSTQSWIWSVQNQYTYTNNKLTTQQRLRYDKTSSEWINDLRYVYEYDTKHGEAILAYVYEWDADDEDWCYKTRTEKAYDDDSANKLRYQLDATYTNCKISKYDLKRYYYRCDPKTYTISFYAWNDTLLLTVPATEGTTAAYPDSEELPVKTGDKEYTYTFAGWTPALAIVTGDASYKATYTSTKKTYTVTFQNDDNTPLQSTQVEYGLMPAYTGETPAKAKTDQYTYTFSGWSPAVVAVEDNATYTAQFTPTVNQYTIKFVIGDQTYPMTLDYGTSLTAIVNQVRQDYGDSYQTKEYVYTFDGWVEGEPETVTGDATYTMKYKQADRTYAITFNNYDDQLLQTVQVAYGQTPSYTGETPVKAGDTEWSYQFDGWTPELVAVDGAATYTAVFKEQKNKYTITFVIGENSYPLSLEYGTSLSAIVNQVRQDYGDSYQTKVYVYTFDGWIEGEPETVTGDATYTMKYKQADRTYAITFNNYDDQLLQTVQVAYGQTPSYSGETPVKAEDAEYTYTFGGWTPEVAAVEGDAVYTATFTATPKVPTGIENTDAAGQATKIYREGQIYILRNGKMYDVNGKEVE